ncbi:wall-associated receptor kinase 2 [Cajanus cajan]|uniref:Wall-associated receptor kinase 2 n=1 Tax=Cajanus cajan TaxID=3821 RepID=A0A151UFM3_CAJCA|nr:wall-associated receptor kinase 2 [Cajanus cajan]
MKDEDFYSSFFNSSFLITCNKKLPAPIPYLKDSFGQKVRVLDISLDGKLNISLPVATRCTKHTNNESVNGRSLYEFDLAPFHLSPKQNKLTVVGADAAGIIYENITSDMLNATAACVSLSFYVDGELASNESCTGTHCCDTPIQQSLSSFLYYSTVNIFNSNYSNPQINNYSCGYAFLVKDGAYQFTTTKGLDKNTFPVVLDWAVGNQTDTWQDHSACKSEHSQGHPAEAGPGYNCNCSAGWRGNPYLLHGCTDIDECKESSHECFEGARCENFPPGNYTCHCPDGHKGDGRKSGTKCTRKGKDNIIIIALSVSVSILTFIGGTFYVYWTSKKRKLMKLKEHFFQQNGGLFLQQEVARYSGSNEMTKIFTMEELKEATNNFDEGTILGQGGQGTVYKGILPDNRIAIKMSKISNTNQIEHFINEVILLSRINHRNVVKLLGCCLETEVPLLVYEFIPNSTVYEHLHDQSQSLRLTWKTRLQIATGSAGALAYLHSATTTPIIHRDVKTTNILLDHNLTAKVADFGASRIIPLDQTQLTTLVQGTLGYLDPEYFHTSQLTEKSDVYSFGVVLVELLTGKKALSFDRPETHRNLAMHFHSSINEGGLLNIIDSQIIDEANVEQLMDVANIAKHCLRLKGEERPTMKEVATELEAISIVEKHRWEKVNLSLEETENLLKATPSYSFSVVDGADKRSLQSGSDSLSRISLSLNGR